MTHRQQASHRRQALTEAGCSTYVLCWREGVPGITCLCCGFTSYNPGDCLNKYCGRCQTFHSEEQPDEISNP